jgi:hypothetical protein
MAFSDYKNIGQVQKEFNIQYQEETFVRSQPVPPTPTFVTEFEFNQRNIDVYASEAARTEMIIAPVLREVYKDYYEQLAFWIQKPITYTAILSGTPDYIISMKSALGKTVLETPLLLVVEAKRNDFEQGWGQCLAELVAAQKLNETPELALYGIVTDGKLWEMGKLINSVFTKNVESFTVDHLAHLFGALHFVFAASATNLVTP